jgi:formylglycine-generating enzyme required for sulfatase activity
LAVTDLQEAALQGLENFMARIFVSYSRKNIDFAKRLTGTLQERELDFWVDWEGIPPTVDWMREIQKGIEEADTFLFIISPDSISSKVCKEELELAVKNGKRLIPVVAHEIKWDEVPAELSHLNYIFFRESDDFNAALDKLLTAIDTNYDWVQTHRRLQVKALEWERSNKDNGFLLRGKDLEEAERQISIHATTNPRPTDIQREYVLKSRQATDRQKRIATGVLMFITLVMIGITAVLAIPRILNKIAQSRARGEMILIPEGPSIFGTDNEAYIKDFGLPPRQTIPSLPAFQIGKYEVSNYQYGLCVKYGDCTVPIVPTDFKDDAIKDLPVVNVTLFQANTYCQWLGQRLPNQFEWERAARGPDLYEWPWGNDQEPTPETANMPWKEFSPEGLQPVISNPDGKSPEGIYNLMGNASEWTSSLIVSSIAYETSQIWDGSPESFDGTKTYARRGGGWKLNVDEVAIYDSALGLSARNDLGIRCAADAK